MVRKMDLKRVEGEESRRQTGLDAPEHDAVDECLRVSSKSECSRGIGNCRPLKDGRQRRQRIGGI